MRKGDNSCAYSHYTGCTAPMVVPFLHRVYLDFFNIIQPACDIEWIIAGDEAHNMDIFLEKTVAEHLKQCNCYKVALVYGTPSIARRLGLVIVYNAEYLELCIL